MMIMMTTTMMMAMLPLQANDLVFIKNSPDYCHSNHTIGSLGEHHYDDNDDEDDNDDDDDDSCDDDNVDGDSDWVSW